MVVDIQHVRHPDHYDAFLHYHCIAILEQVAKSENYHPQLAVYSIVVLTSGDKHQVDLATIDFDPKTRNGNGLGEIPHKVVYLCPKYVNDETPAQLCEWLRAINDTLTATHENQPFESMVNKLLLEGLDAHLTVRQLLERTAQHYRSPLSKQQKQQQSSEEVLQNLGVIREQVADELYP